MLNVTILIKTNLDNKFEIIEIVLNNQCFKTTNWFHFQGVTKLLRNPIKDHFENPMTWKYCIWKGYIQGGKEFLCEAVKLLFYYSWNVISENKNSRFVTQAVSVTRDLEKL